MENKKLKVLNLYAGIGGNRKLWGGEIKVVAIENNPKIAEIYKDFFPQDEVIVCDAHQYLLEHFEEFDFIWSSPPCPSHSRIRKYSAVLRGQNKPIFPDMKLYEEILFLQGYFKGKWVVENVISWYKPLIEPQEINRHFFWANFKIDNITKQCREHLAKIDILQKRKGFDLSKYKGIDKKLLLRNCVEPETGIHLLNMAFRENSQTKLNEEAVSIPPNPKG